MTKSLISGVILSFSVLVVNAQLEPRKSHDVKLDESDFGKSAQFSAEDGTVMKESRHPITSKIHLTDSVSLFMSLMDSIDSNVNGLEGFRVQLFSNSGPNAKPEAFKRQADFIQIYPDFPSYTLWSSPNWVLRAGDFRTRLEARQFLDEIRFKYPAAFIVTDIVASKYAD